MTRLTPRNRCNSTRPAARLLSIVLLACLAGCGGAPDVAGWRAEQAELTKEGAAPAAPAFNLDSAAAEIEALRRGRELDKSRERALALVREHPEDAKALFLASRAESDAVFLFATDDKENRKLAALSSLEYARGMAKAGAKSADTVAQFAWALGTTTHLQPMMDRSRQANETMKTIQQALDLDPDQPTALAALAILHLRLATLPWIARVMASGAPDGTLEEAEKAARHAVKVRPSIENRVILAKCLIAAEKSGDAAKVLEEALAAADRFPRDTALRPDGERLLKSLRDD
jgi:tetratricopeptide (TPR) repeat protein